MPGYEIVEFYTSRDGRAVNGEHAKSVAATLIADKERGTVRRDGTIVTDNPINLRQELATDINCCAELTRVF